MSHQADQIIFELPSWLAGYRESTCHLPDVDTRMAFVVEASRRNLVEVTGGPFAAAVFESDSGKLVSLGVNLVPTQQCSLLHAEVVAIALAQQVLGTYDMGGEGLPAHELVTSTEPCAMCLGATAWSGVRRVVCGARDEDARSVGFDEGAKPRDWKGALEARGIEVVTDVLR